MTNATLSVDNKYFACRLGALSMSQTRAADTAVQASDDA